MPFTVYRAFEREKNGLLTVKNNNVNTFHGNKNLICHTKPIQLVGEVRRKTCSRCYFGAIKWSKSHPFSAHTGSQRIAQHDIFTFRSLSSQLEFPVILGSQRENAHQASRQVQRLDDPVPKWKLTIVLRLFRVLNLVRPLTVLQKIKSGTGAPVRNQKKNKKPRKKRTNKREKKIHCQGSNPVPLRQKHSQTYHECFYTYASNHRQKHFLKPLFVFLGRGHNFNRTKIVDFPCNFTDLPTYGLTHNAMI